MEVVRSLRHGYVSTPVLPGRPITYFSPRALLTEFRDYILFAVCHSRLGDGLLCNVTLSSVMFHTCLSRRLPGGLRGFHFLGLLGSFLMNT